MPDHRLLWINVDGKLVHPWAPAGGAGRGVASLPGPLCGYSFAGSDLPHPNAPAVRNVPAQQALGIVSAHQGLGFVTDPFRGRGRHHGVVTAHRAADHAAVAATPWAALLETIEHHVDYIHIAHGVVRVSPPLFKRVAAAMRDSRIIMTIGVPSGGGDFEYRWQNRGATTGKMIFGPSFDIRKQHTHALFIHECVHAICDLLGVRVDRITGEMVAYAAQLMYSIHHGLSRKSHLSAESKALSQAARTVATELLRHGQPTEAQWHHLRSAISSHSVYSGSVGVIDQFDGL